jgi:hypothetical protein
MQEKDFDMLLKRAECPVKVAESISVTCPLRDELSGLL